MTFSGSLKQSCDKCRDKQNIDIEFTITYLAFVQIGHVISGHLLFHKEVLNSKVTGIFRSPVALIALILSTLNDIESMSTSTGTDSKFHRFLSMNITKMKEGGGMITTATESQSLQNSSMECPQEPFGLITKFEYNTNLKSSGIGENSPPFTPLVSDGMAKPPPYGGLKDTSTPPKMLTSTQNKSSVSSQEVITSFYPLIVSSIFVQKLQ